MVRPLSRRPIIPARSKTGNVANTNERQLLQEVGTKAISLRRKFAKELALEITAAEDETEGAANLTADKQLQFQIRLSESETEATTWILADTECVTNQLDREIFAITSNEQKRFKREFSSRLILCEACWETIRIEALWKTIKQRMVHYGYPKMHLVIHISKSIR